MIVFDLTCSNGHSFEGWFDDIQAYENQNADHLIACPVCNDTSIEKRPSSFGIKSNSNIKKHSLSDDLLKQFSEKFTEFVNKNFDDVGSGFTKEALKIHYGVSKPRNIKGVSTKEEEEVLKKEGIDFFKIPVAKSGKPHSDS
jgi:hypothetical protein